ncbi:MAG: helix-turn-helix domain-containing protein [Lachnospiraceae bacterium]|nr:helix-turn-helix domain-containing protein [Lachnospiraceae bacterium]
MNSVERVKQICKEKKIPISKLEKELGYSNGYISQLRKGVFPSDRITEIANFLNISTEYLMTGEERTGRETYYLNDETTRMAQDIFENKELRILFDAARDAQPEDLQAVHNMLLALKRKEQHYDN